MLSAAKDSEVRRIDPNKYSERVWQKDMDENTHVGSPLKKEVQS